MEFVSRPAPRQEGDYVASASEEALAGARSMYAMAAL